MVRISSVVFSLAVAACAAAAPMQRRQTGDLDCNLARLKIIFDVAATQKLVGQINSTDLATASAVAVAQTGLDSVNSAIQDILAAVFAGQTAPAASRDQVSQGLNTANSALSLIKDPSLNATVTEAQARLLTAGADGDKVVADCK
ncbi:hypothetical protein MVEN_02449300 [Mycena venus]|uniref:Cell wall protein n=1 Tax=Mycena venus TaxID=2733690 RepID=A0A8H7CBC3_9AGAR|nr:hypothetical protein MVEN_02449300 [Mycena venus]